LAYPFKGMTEEQESTHEVLAMVQVVVEELAE
jgi:hypothetical protein